jgi:hypothetical protein
MTTSPEDRLQAVEARLLTIQAVADSLEAAGHHAHLTDRHDIGAQVNLLVDRLREELDAALAIASRRG